MKKIRPAIFLMLSLLAVSLSGCATTYKTEKAADITMSAAMTAWGDYVAANHPPVTQELQVRDAFRKYQAAEILAIDATKGIFDLTATNATSAGTNDPATAQLVAKARVQAATTAAASALADLVGLITSFGVKITTN